MQLKSLGSLQEFFKLLQAAELQIRAGGRYTAMDRYRDFNAVFGTEQGARVLAQITKLAENYPISFNQVNEGGYLAFRAGMAEVANQILQILHTQPQEMDDE